MQPSTSDDHPSFYTVARASNRRGPHLITCLNSDANPAKLRQPGPVVDSTGATCYWNTDDPQTAVLVERWKKTLGKIVAKLLGLSEDKNDEDWRFTDFPKGYKLFRYNKGEREDTYLLGSDHVTKFRTANEFSPHLHWLCTTQEPSKANRSKCNCKYCSGSKCQNLVNFTLGLDKNARLSDAFEPKSASHNKRKAEEEMAKENVRKRTTSDSVASRSTARPTSKTNTSRKSFPAHVINSAMNGGTPSKKQTFQGPYVNKDRDRDLSELQCTFRQAELVWCKLDRPYDAAPEGMPDVKIDYWPAICEERVLKSVPEVSSVDSDPKADRARKTDSQPFPLTLKVQQNYQWKVRLLGACDVYWKDESELLAYLNYPTPEKLFTFPFHPTSLPHIIDGHATDRPTISSFKTISDAITAFALSLQITVHIKKSFTLVDRYDITFLKRIEARGEKLSPEEMQILYEDSTLPWYQCLWWGAEKIWSGELVRLMVRAADLPIGLRAITPGPHPRCFFLKITGLYRSAQEKGMVKGSIFELAPVAQRAIDEAEKVAEFDESLFHNSLQHLNRYMPEAPAGYFFRRLTPVGKEHHLVLQHIAGRYYPPQSLAIPPAPGTGDAADFSPVSVTIEGRSLSLCGMTEGKWLHMHCETWVSDRKECFKAAEAAGERELLITVAKLSSTDAIKTKSVQVTDMSSDAGSESRVALGATRGPDAAMVAGSQDPAATAGAEDVEMVIGDLNQKFDQGSQVGLSVSTAETGAKQTTDGQPGTDAEQIPIAVTEVSGPSVTAETKATGQGFGSSEALARLGAGCANVNPASMGDGPAGAVPDPQALLADLVMQDSSGTPADSTVTAPVVENVDATAAPAPIGAGPDPRALSADLVMQDPSGTQADSKVAAPVVETVDATAAPAPIGAGPDPRALSADLVTQDSSGTQADSKVAAPVVENVDATATLDAQGSFPAGANPLIVSAGPTREISPAVTVTQVGNVTEEVAQPLPAAAAPLAEGTLPVGTNPLTVSAGQAREKSPQVTGTLVGSGAEKLAQPLLTSPAPLSSSSMEAGSTPAPVGLTASPQVPEVLPVVADGMPSAAGLGSVAAVTGNDKPAVTSSSGLETVPVPTIAVDPYRNIDPAFGFSQAPIAFDRQPTLDPLLAAQSFLPVAASQGASARQAGEAGEQQPPLCPDPAGLVASSLGDAGTAPSTKQADLVVGSLGQALEPKEPGTLPTIPLAGLPEHAQPGLPAASDEPSNVAWPAGISGTQVDLLASEDWKPSPVGFGIDTRPKDSESGVGGGGGHG